MARISRFSLGILLVSALAVLAAGCGAPKPKKKNKKAKEVPAASAPEAPTAPDQAGFVVVQIDGDAQVVAQADLESVRFEVRSSYREALNQYKLAKKKAEADKAAFDRPKPPKPKIKISRKVFPTEAEAETYRQVLIARKKTEKKAPPPPPAAATPQEPEPTKEP